MIREKGPRSKSWLLLLLVVVLGLAYVIHGGIQERIHAAGTLVTATEQSAIASR
ncbi:MAG: hypothetical protein WDO73_22610 [Ignavibacteriota bacterium]